MAMECGQTQVVLRCTLLYRTTLVQREWSVYHTVQFPYMNVGLLQVWIWSLSGHSTVHVLKEGKQSTKKNAWSALYTDVSRPWTKLWHCRRTTLWPHHEWARNGIYAYARYRWWTASAVCLVHFVVHLAHVFFMNQHMVDSFPKSIGPLSGMSF